MVPRSISLDHDKFTLTLFDCSSCGSSASMAPGLTCPSITFTLPLRRLIRTSAMPPCELSTSTILTEPSDVFRNVEKEKAGKVYVDSLPKNAGRVTDHFSSLFLSGSVYLTLCEIIMFFALFVCFTIPSTSVPIMEKFGFEQSPNSLPCQHLPYLLLSLSLFRRVYNSYLEVSYLKKESYFKALSVRRIESGWVKAPSNMCENLSATVFFYVLKASPQTHSSPPLPAPGMFLRPPL